MKGVENGKYQHQAKLDQIILKSKEQHEKTLIKFQERFSQGNDSFVNKEEAKYEERKKTFYAEYKKVKRAFVISKLKKQFDSQT